MKKRKKQKPMAASTRKALLSLFALFVAFFFSWLTESLYTVRLPDSEHPVELYSTDVDHDLSLIVEKAILNAKKSVTLAIYSLTDPKIISALREKSFLGCDVKVICDAKTCPEVEKKLGPQVKILKRFIKGLMHIKILIIDDNQTWIGSANMTGESLRHHSNLIAAIESASLAEMTDAKLRTFTATDRLLNVTHRQFPLGQQNVEMWFLPDDISAVNTLKKWIRSAKKTLQIAMFTWTRYDLAQEIISAKKRGVRIKIVLDRGAALGAGSKVTKMLIEAGLDIKTNKGLPLLHHKLMIIDNQTLINGSANWTKAAFATNDDCFFILHPLLDNQQIFLQKMWKNIEAESIPLNFIDLATDRQE